jgi:hypothetical protein
MAGKNGKTLNVQFRSRSRSEADAESKLAKG